MIADLWFTREVNEMAMKEKIVREIGGSLYNYTLTRVKKKGSKYLTKVYRYDGPVKPVYALRLDDLTKQEKATLDRGFRKGMSVAALALNISDRWKKGRTPADSTMYQWFAKRGVKRSK